MIEIIGRFLLGLADLFLLLVETLTRFGHALIEIAATFPSPSVGTKAEGIA